MLLMKEKGSFHGGAIFICPYMGEGRLRGGANQHAASSLTYFSVFVDLDDGGWRSSCSFIIIIVIINHYLLITKVLFLF